MSEGRDGTEGFYYNRDDRLKNASESVKDIAESTPGKRRGGVFRRNRGLVIVFLDIAIILILFGIYHFFLRPDTRTAKEAGHQAELDAVAFEGEILVAVRVTKLDEEAAFGLFSLRLMIDESEVYSTQDLLPRAVAEEVVVRTVLTGEARELVAVIELGDNAEMRLRAPLSGRVDRP